MAINFYFLEPVSLKNRRALKLCIQSLLETEANRAVGNLNFIFCDDEYLLNINRQSLNHDYYTDIITFDLSENTRVVDAEIYISVTRVKDNATTHNVSFFDELHRVIFHGLLHLCGYKDKLKKDVSMMRSKESEWLDIYKSQLVK